MTQLSRLQVIASRRAQREQQQEQSQFTNLGSFQAYITDMKGTKVSDVRIGKANRPYVAIHDKDGKFLDILMFSKELKRLHDIKPFNKLDLLELPIYSGVAKTQKDTPNVPAGTEFIWVSIGVEGSAPDDLTDITDMVKQRDELRAAAAKLGATA